MVFKASQYGRDVHVWFRILCNEDCNRHGRSALFFYKLQMMGIPLAGPTSVFCDNESVVKGS